MRVKKSQKDNRRRLSLVPLCDKFILFVSFVLFIGCSSIPEKKIEGEGGQWQVQAYIHDFKRSKSFFLDMDIIAQYPDRVRIEATSNLGISVLHLVMIGKNVQYILPQQKKYYEGPISQKELNHLGISIDPSLFIDLLYEKKLKEEEWSCDKNSQGIVRECKNKTTNLIILWKEKNMNKSKFQIKSDKFKVQIVAERIQPKVQLRDEVFKIPRPMDY